MLESPWCLRINLRRLISLDIMSTYNSLQRYMVSKYKPWLVSNFWNFSGTTLAHPNVAALSPYISSSKAKWLTELLVRLRTLMSIESKNQSEFNLAANMWFCHKTCAISVKNGYNVQTPFERFLWNFTRISSSKYRIVWNILTMLEYTSSIEHRCKIHDFA